MAINPSTNATMAGRITAADANYPYGSSKDETAPGAGDGTPYFLARANDIFGFQQALLKAAGIVPSGNADTVLVSQYAQSLVELISGRAYNYDESGVADAYVLDVRTDQHAPQSYFDGLEARFSPGNANTGACTANIAGLGGKSIKTKAGADPAAGDLPAGGDIILRYDLTNDWLTIDNATAANAFGDQLLHIQDQKTSGTDGGTFTSGAKRTRDLNTVLINGISGASLSTNQITLPAGTYFVMANAPAYRVDPHKLTIYNVTDAAYELDGTSERSDGSYFTQTRSFVAGTFTLAASKVLELSHECTTTKSTNGFGNSCAFGEPEVYADVKIWKVA